MNQLHRYLGNDVNFNTLVECRSKDLNYQLGLTLVEYNIKGGGNKGNEGK